MCYWPGVVSGPETPLTPTRSLVGRRYDLHGMGPCTPPTADGLIRASQLRPSDQPNPAQLGGSPLADLGYPMPAPLSLGSLSSRRKSAHAREYRDNQEGGPPGGPAVCRVALLCPPCLPITAPPRTPRGPSCGCSNLGEKRGGRTGGGGCRGPGETGCRLTRHVLYVATGSFLRLGRFPGGRGMLHPPPSNDDVTGVVARITDSPHPSALVIEKRGWLARWCPIHLPGLSTSEMGNSTAEHAALRRTYNQTYALYARRPLSVK